jgi:amidase
MSWNLQLPSRRRGLAVLAVVAILSTPLAARAEAPSSVAALASDVAIALGAMTGIDPADAATRKSEGRFSTDYTKDLKTDALKGARIGIARDFLGADPDSIG